MALETRERCERCGRDVRHDDAVPIRSYECVIRGPHGEETRDVGPDRGGESVPRPRRSTAV